MRLSILLVPVLASAVPASSQSLYSDAPSPAVVTVLPADQGENCRRATSYYADLASNYRGDRVVPRNLSELPSGSAYMAVYRTIDGCEEPMTLTEYRGGRL